MLTQAARNGLSAPVNLTWEMTLECNLRCRHCLSNSGVPHPDELSTIECLSVIDELARLKVFQINIGGGEPFIRPDFFEILAYAEEKGIVSCVSTNGTLLDRDACRQLSTHKGLYLQVSLDGVNEESNDAIRGKGSYRRALRGMQELANHGVDFSINMVLMRHNYDQLEAFKMLAADVGASLRVSRFRPSGRGKENWEELAPDKVQLENFARWLENDTHVLTGDSFFSLTSERRRRLGLDLCGAAKMTCCLSPLGDFYPCAFLQESRFQAGNVRQVSLKETWLHSEVFRTFRELEVKSCHSCHRFDSCRGGCPAVAYHTHKDLSQPDPECLMQCLSLKTECA
jgi:[mycofactocin precursor peptide]-tyrosine decarboxylase / 3-amino-5-[(4-hydroxyphenyl)methyl]-4,4-dimethylpyrrolidin-2-one synthase